MEAKGQLRVLFLMSVFGLCCGLLGNRFWKIRENVEKSQEAMARKLLRQDKRHYETCFIEQPLDHFNALSKDFGKTYKQRYYINEEWWDGPNSPVFLLIGGEGSLSWGYIKFGEMANVGKRRRALLIAVEHRYYGMSINEDGLQLEELQYLSSQQALADLASLVHYIKKKYKIPDSTPWISFGGSYPGALSAWFRIKYPHLVAGAVASSAPVLAEVDFKGYNLVVAASLNNTMVGGSPQCLDAVSTAFRQIDNLVERENFAKLQKDFKICEPISDRMDALQFASNVASYFQGIVQYNKVTNQDTIESTCKLMLSDKNPYTSLIKLNEYVMKLYDTNCTEGSYQKFIDGVSNTTVVKEATGVGMRSWLYQTCSQFGYYATCEQNSTCPFSHLLDLEVSGPDICENVFKMHLSDVNKNIEFSNDYYGGRDIRQTNIVFVNGDIDPWHSLSVLTPNEKRGVYSILIPGSAHCADLHHPKFMDPNPVKKARTQVISLVDKFLAEAKTNY